MYMYVYVYMYVVYMSVFQKTGLALTTQKNGSTEILSNYLTNNLDQRE